MVNTRQEFVLPDLDLGDVPIVAGVWLKSKGQEVVEGERLLEVVAGDVVVDLPAPISGNLTEQLVEETDLLQVGQVLGLVSNQQPGDMASGGR